MKKLLLGALLFTGGVFAQNVEPQFEIEGNLIRATYFYDNGKVKEQGFYKDGKVHGQWISFSEDGIKTAVGEYVNGTKVGKWHFYKGKDICDVTYVNNRIENNHSMLAQRK